MKPIMLGSPLRCAQSSDSAGLSPQGSLFLLGFDERNLRAQHPQLLEKGTERGPSEQDMGNSFLSEGPLPPCREGCLLRQCWGILVRIPLLSSPYFKHPWGITPLLCKYLMPSPNIVQPNTSQVIVLLQPFQRDLHWIFTESMSKSQHYKGIFIAIRQVNVSLKQIKVLWGEGLCLHIYHLPGIPPEQCCRGFISDSHLLGICQTSLERQKCCKSCPTTKHPSWAPLWQPSSTPKSKCSPQQLSSKGLL